MKLSYDTEVIEGIVSWLLVIVIIFYSQILKLKTNIKIIIKL